MSADQAQPAGERQLSSLSGRRFPTTDQIPSGAPNAVDAVKTRLHTQVAIYARDFGALLGMSPAETTEAIGKKRLGVPTFQLVENGIHRVSSRVVLDFFAARGIEL